MKKLNNKGIITFTTFVLWMVGSSTVAAVVGTNSFRERKAIEYCTAEGHPDCGTIVKNMSADERLAYIKDTQDQPR